MVTNLHYLRLFEFFVEKASGRTFGAVRWLHFRGVRYAVYRHASGCFLSPSRAAYVGGGCMQFFRKIGLYRRYIRRSQLTY